MKKLLSLALLLISLDINAQKEDYIWLFGYLPNVPDQYFGGSKMDFHSFPPQLSFFDIPLNIATGAILSDGQGNLLFYSSGC